jgi:hypothetical protein
LSFNLYDEAVIHFENKTTNSKEFITLILIFGKDRLRKCWKSWKRTQKRINIKVPDEKTSSKVGSKS